MELFPPHDWTIAALAVEVQARCRTCLDVLEMFLNRIDTQENKVHAWVIVDRIGARDQARRLDAELAAGRWRGPLHGMPIGVKDIMDVAGLPTSAGFGPWADRVAHEDAEIVARLRAAGAVILGKTVTTPFAWIDPPPTANPWNLDRTPGGSSSGSAAALAAGMCAGAMGSQTGGSITRPAAFCGVTGLKPTFQGLPTRGIVPLAPSLDHPGPLARTVADLAMLWNALAGQSSEPRAGREPWRIGRLRGFFDDRADPEAARAVDRAQESWAGLGIETIDAPEPADFEAILGRHRTILAFEAADWHGPIVGVHPEDYPPRIRALVEHGRAIPETAYLQARRQLEADRHSCPGWFAGFDAFLTPAALGPAPDRSTTGDPVVHSPWSYLGLPTVTFPVALSESGLPLGVQLIGPPDTENDLLGLAAACAAGAKRPDP